MKLKLETHEKFSEVDRAVAINITARHHSTKLRGRHVLANLLHHHAKFFAVDRPRPIAVQGCEVLLETRDLRRREILHKSGRNSVLRGGTTGGHGGKSREGALGEEGQNVAYLSIFLVESEWGEPGKIGSTRTGRLSAATIIPPSLLPPSPNQPQGNLRIYFFVIYI